MMIIKTEKHKSNGANNNHSNSNKCNSKNNTKNNKSSPEHWEKPIRRCEAARQLEALWTKSDLKISQSCNMWGIPKIGDPNIVP